MTSNHTHFQQAPATVLAVLVSLASDPSTSPQALQSAVLGIKPALEGYQQNGLLLHDLVLAAHADPDSPDHATAKRIITSVNVCRHFEAEAIRAGRLREHLQLSEELLDYARVIRDGELDGSEPELAELLEQLGQCNHALRATESDRVL